MPQSISYSDAGVSIDNADKAISKIRELAHSTFTDRTLTEIGSFGGMFSAVFPDMEEPILVASADGVGTKLKIAFQTGIHNTLGADLVNHCVNDILVQAPDRFSSSIILQQENSILRLLRRLLKVWHELAERMAAYCLAAKRRRCPIFMPLANMT